MSSVQDTTRCPQCRRTAIVDFQTRTMAESVFCPNCGYTAHTDPVIDRVRQAADPEHRNWFMLRRDGQRIFRTTQRRGHGAYRFSQRNGFAQVGMMPRPVTRQTLARFKRDLQANPNLDPARCYLTRWNARRRKLDVLFGKLPRFPY